MVISIKLKSLANPARTSLVVMRGVARLAHLHIALKSLEPVPIPM